MPIRMMIVIALVVFASVFTGFNLENKCTVWFFHSFTNLPVVSVMLGSFVAGVVVMLPFTLGKGNRSEKKSKSYRESKELKFNERKTED